jgi:CRISPR/Cas system-associated protein Csm6
MNTLKVSKSVVLGLILFVSVSSVAWANMGEDRTTDKARAEVAKASADDWQTLAANAEKCFRKKVNMKEASEWLDRSLQIAETRYNLELKGDYYSMNNLQDKAVEYYIKAINVVPDKSASEVIAIQKKIAKIRNIGQ